MTALYFPSHMHFLVAKLYLLTDLRMQPGVILYICIIFSERKTCYFNKLFLDSSWSLVTNSQKYFETKHCYPYLSMITANTPSYYPRSHTYWWAHWSPKWYYCIMLLVHIAGQIHSTVIECLVHVRHWTRCLRYSSNQNNNPWSHGTKNLAIGDTHESEQALGVGDGQRGLACCSPWSCKESDTTEQLNWRARQWKICIINSKSYCVNNENAVGKKEEDT